MKWAILILHQINNNFPFQQTNAKTKIAAFDVCVCVFVFVHIIVRHFSFRCRRAYDYYYKWLPIYLYVNECVCDFFLSLPVELSSLGVARALTIFLFYFCFYFLRQFIIWIYKFLSHSRYHLYSYNCLILFWKVKMLPRLNLWWSCCK